MATNMAATVKRSYHILNVFYVPGAMPSTQTTLSCLVLKSSLTGGYKSLDFTDEKNEDLLSYLGTNSFCRPGFQSRFHTLVGYKDFQRYITLEMTPQIIEPPVTDYNVIVWLSLIAKLDNYHRIQYNDENNGYAFYS